MLLGMPKAWKSQSVSCISCGMKVSSAAMLKYSAALWPARADACDAMRMRATAAPCVSYCKTRGYAPCTRDVITAARRTRCPRCGNSAAAIACAMKDPPADAARRPCARPTVARKAMRRDHATPQGAQGFREKTWPRFLRENVATENVRKLEGAGGDSRGGLGR